MKLMNSARKILTILSFGIFVVLLTTGAQEAQSATYTSDQNSTTAGESYWGVEALELEVEITGSIGTFTVSTTSNDPFRYDGTMYLKVGTPEDYGVDHGVKSITKDESNHVIFTDDLDAYEADTYPKEFYARLENPGNDTWAWVGPITITRAEDQPPQDNLPEGEIIQPGFSAENNITVQVSASDDDGIDKVSVVFAANGTPLVMCEDGTANPCDGTSGNWTLTDINPKDYSVTGSGDIKLGLWVRDELANSELAASKTINWTESSIPPDNIDPTGEIIQPDSAKQGNITVTASASDNEGLEKVSVVFVTNGTPLVMCEDGTANPCEGTSGNWTLSDVNPADYGATNSGEYTLGLWVKDEDSDTKLANTRTFLWETAPENTSPTGTIDAPHGLEVGTISVSATASDADGIRKVSAVFVPYGEPLVLCEDGTENPCPETDGNWTVENVNPSEYGASGGTVTMGLHVQDDDNGNTETLAAAETFTWIPAKNQFPTETRYIDICEGHNYEQQMPVEGVEMPSVSISGPAEAKAGETIELSADAFVDTENGGNAFFYWCAERGKIIYDDAHPDKIKFIVPFVPGPGEAIRVMVQVGDGLGYIDTDFLTINVSGTLTKIAHSTSGTIHPGETLNEKIPFGNFVNKLFALVVKWPGSDIDLRPITPEGQQIDYTNENVFGFYEGDTQEYYVVYNDKQGEWSADLVAVDVDPNGEPYEFIVYTEEDENQNKQDSDNDGLPDTWEQENFGNLDQDATTDFDGDGILDIDEFKNNLNPLKDESDGDADCDGYTNAQEIEAGTDLFDAASKPDHPVVQCDYSVPADYSTIQDAIDAAHAAGGSIVCVSPGTYAENITLKDGVWLVSESGDPADTIIQGDGKKDVVVIEKNDSGGIVGFTIRSSGTNGNFAGIDVNGNDDTPTIANCVIKGNNNGIVISGNSDPEIVNNVITDNTGNGIRCNGNSEADIYNNIIVNNGDEGIRQNGQLTLRINYNDIWNNNADSKKKDKPSEDGESYEDMGQGNMSQDPLFAAPDADDYHLMSGSPCIDIGNPDVQDKDGSVSDLGVYGGTIELPTTSGPPSPKEYTVTIRTEGDGSGTVSHETQKVACGSSLTVTATPNDDSEFAGWSGDASGTGDAVLSNITSDMTLIATFTLTTPLPDDDDDSTANNGSDDANSGADDDSSNTSADDNGADDADSSDDTSEDKEDTDPDTGDTDDTTDTDIGDEDTGNTSDDDTDVSDDTTVSGENEGETSDGDVDASDNTTDDDMTSEDTGEAELPDTNDSDDAVTDDNTGDENSPDADDDSTIADEDESPHEQVTSTLMAATETGEIMVDTSANPDTYLTDVASLSDDDEELNQTGKLSGYTFMHGLVSFAINGVGDGLTIQVKINFPSEIPENAKCFKVNADGFYEFTDVAFDGNTAILTLTDGGSGDDDGATDGIISDPVGIAVPEAGSSAKDDDDDSGPCFISAADSAQRHLIFIVTFIMLLSALPVFVLRRVHVKKQDK